MVHLYKLDATYQLPFSNRRIQTTYFTLFSSICNVFKSVRSVCPYYIRTFNIQSKEILQFSQESRYVSPGTFVLLCYLNKSVLKSKCVFVLCYSLGDTVSTNLVILYLFDFCFYDYSETSLKQTPPP